MAAYAFENISADQAAGFTAGDYLFFVTSGATANAVTVSPFQNGSVGSGISLTYAGKTVTFPGTISAASFNDHIQFNDGSHLQIGTTGNDTTGFGPNADGNPVTAYGLDGNDTLNFSTTAASTANYLNGGFGADTINGGNGNNHIYGNALGVASGATDSSGAPDGGDTITVLGGTNYINGNGGNDIISAGVAATTGMTPTDASIGANVIRGGSGNDMVTLHGQGANSVNGNTGTDMINASDTTGVNSLRGGQDNDTITAGHGNNTLFGDAGDDHLIAGSGTTTAINGGGTVAKLTIMGGGSGNDTFDFSGSTDAGYAGTQSNGTTGVHSGITVGDSTYYQTITDFTQGQDHIHLSFTPGTTDIVTAGGATFQTVAQAEVYAQGLLSNHVDPTATGAGEIAAIDVNGSTYLFYNHAGTGSIDSIVELQGVSSSVLTQSGSGIHTFG